MSLKIEDYNYVLAELQARYNFTQDHAKDAIDRLSDIPELFNAFVSYLRTGVHGTIGFGGHTVNDLMRNYGLAPAGTYLMLAELAVNPERAKGYMEMIKEEGHEKAEYHPDGSLRKITSSKVGSGDSKAPLCPKCGKPATWIEQYKRWYCYECKEYV